MASSPVVIVPLEAIATIEKIGAAYEAHV